jgi:hypothetical protein
MSLAILLRSEETLENFKEAGELGFLTIIYMGVFWRAKDYLDIFLLFLAVFLESLVS